MAKIDLPIDTLRERLTELLADWGAEMSMVLRELEDARGRLADVEHSAADHEGELEALHSRIDKQQSLIETLRADAEEAGQLRKSLSVAELELEKARAELESKVDLIKMLRADADRKGAAKKSLETVEKALEAERRTNRALGARLDEKRAAVAKLEDSLESQAKTIAELKESVSHWKEQLAGANNAADAATTMRAVPDLPMEILDAGEDEEDDPEAQAATDELAERTLAINMRDALRDARQTQEKGKKKAG